MMKYDTQSSLVHLYILSVSQYQTSLLGHIVHTTLNSALLQTLLRRDTWDKLRGTNERLSILYHAKGYFLALLRIRTRFLEKIGSGFQKKTESPDMDWTSRFKVPLKSTFLLGRIRIVFARDGSGFFPSGWIRGFFLAVWSGSVFSSSPGLDLDPGPLNPDPQLRFLALSCPPLSSGF